MVLVTREISIDMGHRVPNHKSKCRNIHGHRYKIELGVDDKVITNRGESDEGMVIDFSDLKEVLMDIIDKQFDHGFVMYEEDPYREIFERIKAGQSLEESNIWKMNGQPKQKIIFVDFIPTAENLARYWFELLIPIMDLKKIYVKYLKVWETPNSSAMYTDINYIEDYKDRKAREKK